MPPRPREPRRQATGVALAGTPWAFPEGSHPAVAGSARPCGEEHQPGTTQQTRADLPPVSALEYATSCLRPGVSDQASHGQISLHIKGRRLHRRWGHPRLLPSSRWTALWSQTLKGPSKSAPACRSGNDWRESRRSSGHPSLAGNDQLIRQGVDHVLAALCHSNVVGWARPLAAGRVTPTDVQLTGEG